MAFSPWISIGVVLANVGCSQSPCSRSPHEPISVTLPSATMLDVLNGVTKSHGQLSWLVEYSPGYAEFRYSCVLLVTFEGKFVGLDLVVVQGIDDGHACAS